MACRAAKSLSLFADLHCTMGEKKAVQSFCSDTALFCSLLLYAFSLFSAPLVGFRLLRLCLKL